MKTDMLRSDVIVICHVRPVVIRIKYAVWYLVDYIHRAI